MVTQMSEFNRPNAAYAYESGMTLNEYIRKVFLLMTGGLAVTTAVAAFGFISFVNQGIVYQLLAGIPFLSIVLLVAQLGIAIALGAGISRFSTGTCTGLFFGYSALTGLTFSILPMAYGISNVFVAFLFAAVLFACCAVIGYTTHVDLTRFTGLLFGGLLALVIMSVLSIFIPVLRNSLFIGYAGLLLFLVLTAFDMQKIRSFYYGTADGDSIRSNLAVYSAFQLYLDFINIFLYVLRILGNSRRD